MRQLIPLDMYKSNLAMLLEQGIPQPIAERFWNNKILWLIVMHPEDISKVFQPYFLIICECCIESVLITFVRFIWPIFVANTRPPD